MKTTTPHAAVGAGHLRPALAALSKVVEARSPDPVARSVKVAPVGRGKILLVGRGHDAHFTTTIPGDVPQGTPSFLLPLARIKDEVKGRKAGEPIMLRPDPKAPPPEAIPDTPKLRAEPVELTGDAVRAILDALACASTDENRRVLNGALLEPDGKGRTRAVGTDGRHLFASHPFGLEIREPVILPALKVLSAPILANAPGWTLRLGKEEADGTRPFRFDGEGWSISAKTVEGTYPNYRQVMPPEREFKTGIAFPSGAVADIVAAVKRMPGKGMQNRPVGLRISDGGLALLAREDEKSPFEGLEVPADVKGKPTTVFLNRDYLLKALAIGLHDVAVKDGLSPVRFAGEAGTMIAMPVRIAGEIEVTRMEVLGSDQPRRRPKQPRPAPPPKRKPEQKGENMPTPPRTPAPRPGSNGNGEHPPAPEEEAAAQIAAAKDALRSAMSALNATSAALKAAHKRQRQTEKEVRSVRGALRSLRKVEL